jgi:hypothetical protein
MNHHPLKAAFAVLLVFAPAPAAADIIRSSPSDDQGLTVHNDGSASTGTTVIGELGQGSGLDVLFTGTAGGSSDLMLSNGQGQATITGALNTLTSNPNDTRGITAFNIALAGDALFDWIELSLFGSGIVNFALRDDSGALFTSDTDGAFTFDLANGQNRFAFAGINGQSIAALSFTVTGGDLDSVRQVRIDPAAVVVPEPMTWAMMIFGFGAAGFALRRRRRPLLAQIA